MLTGGEAELEPNIIYLGYLSALPARISAPHVVNLYCCLSGPLEGVPEFVDDSAYKNVNLIVLPNVDDVFATFNMVNQPVVQDLAHHDHMRDLVNALFSDQGLQYLVDTAYRILNNPIIVTDMSNAHLALALGEHPDKDPDSILARLWHDSEENQAPNMEAIEYDKKINILQILRRRTSPYVYRHEILKHRVMTSLVLVHGAEIAKVTMIEHHHPFGLGDSFLFASLVRYVGQELSKYIFYHNNKGRSRSYFLMDLLNNLNMAPKAISRRLASIDYRIQDSMFLGIFRQRNILTHNFQALDMAFVADKIAAPVLSGHLYAVSNDELVVLFNFKDGQEWAAPSLKLLTRYATQFDCLWGMSNIFHSLEEIHTAYSQARSATELGNQYFFIHEICPTRLVVFFSHISTIAMLEVCGKNQPLDLFIDPTVLALKSYDDT
ncbi:MAG: hypothetical protein ACK5L3_11425, partial [Oscillospiraceae bacterium]